MPPRRRVPETAPRRSTRLRGDPSASTSTGSVAAEASTSADVVPPDPVIADRVLHLDGSKVRGTGHWRGIIHKAKMPRTDGVDERLRRLGLIHFVQLGHMPLDHSLLQGLAMFWRPETHTFFFPHDVAFLYGLPTTGRTVTGRTDYDAIQLLQDFALPEDTDMAIVEKCFREKEQKRSHSVMLKKLREVWAQFGVPGADDAGRIDRYTRACVLEIFGCELFPDSTGDSIPCFYLQLLQDLHSSNSVQYNWGAATLAMLYRGLDTAFINNNINIGAPWLLLQLWSYARLLLSRPTITKDFEGWGLPDIDSCPPYGRKWTTRQRSKKVTGPTRSGVDYGRDVCMKMKSEHVVWRPYDHIRDRMPRCAQIDQRMFLLRIPCIHYWVVMWHYADRVMHQFMLYQTVPPPPPEVWSRMEQLMGYQHHTYRGIDWHDIFANEVNKWTNTNEATVIEDRPWSEDIWTDYQRWLSVYGGAHLVLIPDGAATAPVPQAYFAWGVARLCMGCHEGFRRAGKKLLRGCSTSLDIVGEAHRLPRLLESKGLQSDIESIPDTDDEDSAPEPGSIEEQQFMRV
ncbi:Serine/threonine-protein phosphatase 7 long form-like protein [Rhynchospora pubera]|uniref:Serine/threonine-protein phosphatase 7 long form-like protein n=1 Tax=Rhynchospora pubera TaxID=906938 RepID=A0AAV8E2E1_9POAL|nr:Serine/threonine-protein phosphatase 7 long form-like protein [Rhynchospora pubera]